MSVYMIFTRDRTLNPREMEAYFKEVGSTVDGHPMKTLAFYGQHEDLEGPPTEGTVIIEFPSMAAAKAWYDGPAYRKVREHRFKGGSYRVLVIEGVSEKGAN